MLGSISATSAWFLVSVPDCTPDPLSSANAVIPSVNLRIFGDTMNVTARLQEYCKTDRGGVGGFRRAAPQYRDAGWFGDLRPRRYRATESREASRCQCGSSDNGVSLASCARVQALPGKPPRAPRHLNGGLARSRKDRLWPACICPACRRSRMASKGQPAPESQRGTRLGARRFSRVSRARRDFWCAGRPRLDKF